MTKIYLFFYAHSRLRGVGAFNVELLDILHIMLFNLKIKIKSNKLNFFYTYQRLTALQEKVVICSSRTHYLMDSTQILSFIAPHGRSL